MTVICCTINLNASETSAKQEAEIFGIPTTDYTIHVDKIKKNQFLADMLGNCNIDYGTVDKLVKKSKDIFDLRHMKANRPYTVLCTKDDKERAAFMIYEHSTTEFVVFDLRDSLDVNVCQKEITTKLKTAGGIISHSLYQSMKDNGLSPSLVAKMSDVFAWTIDFFSVQKNDKFKIVYEELYADGELIGVGEIKSALFNHFGNDFYGFYFENEALEFPDFYDENAKSLRKAFLKAPLQFSRISSKFNRTRYHPVLKRIRPHLGTDYAAPTGTPILSTADGVVIERSRTRGNGNYVKVKHNSVYTTQYLHMSKFKSDVKRGSRVKQGDVIGYVGSTGLATGPHVCYRFWKNGKQVDPYKQKLPEAKTMDEKLVPEFDIFVDQAKCKLDSIKYPPLPVKEVEEEEAEA